ETVTFDAADTSTYRVDGVVLRLDPTANNIELAVVKSPPGQGFVGVTETESDIFELLLGVVVIPANATSIGPSDVHDYRTFLGTRNRVWVNETRPWSPRLGMLGFNRTSNRWEWWDGSNWVPLAPTVNWETIDGRPVTFDPAPHSHTWDSI